MTIQSLPYKLNQLKLKIMKQISSEKFENTRKYLENRYAGFLKGKNGTRHITDDEVRAYLNIHSHK